MTPLEAVAVIDEISYKPGWNLTAEPGTDPFGSDVIRVSIDLVLTDSRNPDNVVPVTADRRIIVGPWMTEQIIVEQIRYWLVELERHELDEWLRFRGDRVTEAHPPPPPPKIRPDGTKTITIPMDCSMPRAMAVDLGIWDPDRMYG